MRIPIYRLHNLIIKPVESIASSNSTRIIPNFTDEKYKLEQNIQNNITANIAKKQTKPISKDYNTLPEYNNNLQNHSINTQDPYDFLLLSSSFKQLTKSVQITLNISTNEEKSQNQQFVNINNIKSTLLNKSIDHQKKQKFTLYEAENALKEIQRSIIDSASPSLLLNASYLLSATAVISLLNPKLDDDQ
ncbi:hypothetical protein [Clostridium butyricum]|uniref:Uncharacterized protein n=1 Tax=Clostridium butyricum E4 str. BoNT E BL5262 TaxID=632245 RepID=C4IKY5_CLOBU|nr:hypothetical protein [Clostridium butyricum]EDT76567.1 hypothetical protein CBY_0979 [Clostridium butyricum 5521]EEP54695.1 hypothetical protein CLP_1418 [Clostridium butyricum E4 str. BoNT E BL5262]NFL33376.1 hypothetical protein [Clostridium butyricum]NFS18137.1 hypothetical protein [Clostridium butyricum]